METRYLHMTFFWGDKTEVLFRGWPGARGNMYVAALFFVFFMTFLMQLLSTGRLTELGKRRPVLGGLLRTVLYTLETGLAYLVMLALMSFNGGIVLMAVAGSAAGFFLFHSRVFWSKDSGA